MRGRLQIRDKRLFLFGLVLVVLGIAMPGIINVHNFGIYRKLYDALGNDDSLFVLAAAGRLFALNVLRAYPHYLGAFYMIDALERENNRKIHRLLYIPVISMLIVAVYVLIEIIYGIQYDFGVPMVLLVLSLVLFLSIDFAMVAPLKKSIMIFFLLCTVQCLDVMPALNGLGFGRGEASESIKQIASFLNAEAALNIVTMCVSMIMGVNVILYTVLVGDENHIKRVSLQREQQERELMKARMQAAELRNHLELSKLVHDLKTPLTAIQTLVGIVKMGEQDEHSVEQLTRVEGSVEHMSELISEFLDERHFSLTTVQEIVNALRSQISVTEYAGMITYEIPEEPIYLEVNKIRVLRMLVNLLDNAFHAVDSESGRILLQVFSRNADAVPMVCFRIQDNGAGMDAQTQKNAFDSGYSTRGSSGLGLNFVKDVVECHRGTLILESAREEGTTFTICFPGAEPPRS